MTDSNHRNKTKIWVVFTIIMLVMIGLVICCALLFNSTETRETSNKENYSISALACESPDVKDAFFVAPEAISAKHNLKISFKNEKPDKIAYGYVGVFEKSETAKAAESNLHAKYNLYMSENGLDPEILTPSFISSDNTLRINLYTDMDRLNTAVGTLFILTADEQRKIESYSPKTIQNIYKNVGFHCDYNG